MKQLRILHVANSFDPAGDVIRCVEELKKYSRHRHEYILCGRHPYQEKYGYQEPALMEWNTEPALVEHLFDWCDLVLYQFVGWERKWGESSKPSAFRNINIYYDAFTDRFFSIAQYNATTLGRYGLLASSHVGAADFLGHERFRWLPDLIPIDDALYSPDWRDRPPCVSYIKHGEVLDGAVWPQGTARQSLAGTHHPKILFRRKTAATVIIDNICDGHFGLAGCEGLSLGLPTIVFNHEKTREALRGLAEEYPPFIEVAQSVDAAIEAAKRVLAWPASEYANFRRRVRLWAERFYSPQYLIDKYWDPFFEELNDMGVVR